MHVSKIPPKGQIQWLEERMWTTKSKGGHNGLAKKVPMPWGEGDARENSWNKGGDGEMG